MQLPYAADVFAMGQIAGLLTVFPFQQVVARGSFIHVLQEGASND
jgi:hypothetical protein